MKKYLIIPLLAIVLAGAGCGSPCLEYETRYQQIDGYGYIPLGNDYTKAKEMFEMSDRKNSSLSAFQACIKY